MSIIKKIKPQFWDHYDATEGSSPRSLSFRRKWILMVVLTAIVALTPLLVMTFIDFKLTMNMIESEVIANTEKTVSNTWRAISSFLTQRRESLNFVARDNNYEDLIQNKRLQTVLANLQAGIGGFEDIGVLNENGVVQAYAGPHNLQGSNFYEDKCFRIVVKEGFYIKDVHSHTHENPGLVIAVKESLPDGSFFVLRSSMDNAFLYKELSQLEIGDLDDAFVINDEGVLQTASRFHGDIFEKVSLSIPNEILGTKIVSGIDQRGDPVLISYARIPDTSLILMIVKPKSEMISLWYKPRMKLIGFLLLNIGLILVAILGMATYLVNRIHIAHKERMKAVHEVEYTNKLASLGRLASGVAHEINNPLAIINQKAGLIKDLFTMSETYSSDKKLLELIEGVHSSVHRAGSVTKRLLNFASHMETEIESIDLVEVVRDMIGLLEKEAELKCINISLKTPTTGVEIENDQGNLQQIILNIINNSFAAMQDGGTLDIIIKDNNDDVVSVIIQDSGHGIPSEDLKHIFEPFFTSRTGQNSTGLGLSITYGLVREMGGDIAVESKLGEGTRFIITLPVKFPYTDEQNTCRYIEKD